MRFVIFTILCLLLSSFVDFHAQNVDQFYPRNAVDLDSYGVIRVGASREVR